MAQAGRVGKRDWTRAQLIELFGSVLLFSRLPESQLEAIAISAERMVFRRGALIVQQSPQVLGGVVVES